MIQIQAWQVDFHQGKLDLGLLVRTDKLKGILKLYTGGGSLSRGSLYPRGSMSEGSLPGGAPVRSP